MRTFGSIGWSGRNQTLKGCVLLASLKERPVPNPWVFLNTHIAGSVPGKGNNVAELANAEIDLLKLKAPASDKPDNEAGAEGAAGALAR